MEVKTSAGIDCKTEAGRLLPGHSLLRGQAARHLRNARSGELHIRNQVLDGLTSLRNILTFQGVPEPTMTRRRGKRSTKTFEAEAGFEGNDTVGWVHYAIVRGLRESGDVINVKLDRAVLLRKYDTCSNHSQ